MRNVEVFTRLPFTFCDESEAVSNRLRQLTSEYGFTGRQIYDANIVATMAVHGISHLVTQNTRDFEQMGEIQVSDLDNA